MLRKTRGGYSFVIWTEFKIEEPFVIGNVGRFCEQKNQEFLLDVFGEYNKRNANSKLLLLGEGELRSALEEKATALGLKDKVIFAGVHKHPERYYDAMDCFALPSLYEGLGMVLIEAQANGLPCIASTEVPTTANVSDNTVFINLKQPLSVWADEIGKCKNTARIQDIKKISESGYDITIESQKLLGYYEGMIGNVD